MQMFLYWTVSPKTQQIVVGLLVLKDGKTVAWVDTQDGLGVGSSKSAPDKLMEVWNKWEARLKELCTLNLGEFVYAFQKASTDFEAEFHGLLPLETKCAKE